MSDPILTLKTPPEGGVRIDSDNGVYLFKSTDGSEAQLLIKGPMHFNPGWYECSVSAAVGKHMQLNSCEFLPLEQSADAEWHLDALRAGFISLKFEEVKP